MVGVDAISCVLYFSHLATCVGLRCSLVCACPLLIEVMSNFRSLCMLRMLF